MDTGKIMEFYMIMDDLWPIMSQNGMLCVGCLEARIGRELTPVDFTKCYINDARFVPRSERLATRMGLWSRT